MKVGFEIVGAVPKRLRADPETAPTRERMAPVEHRRNPSTDQKKTRVRLTRQAAATKESTMAGTEADLIAKMAAATTLPEQRGYAAQLAAMREARVSGLRQEASLDLATKAVQSRFPMLSTATFTQHTSATDWLGEIEPDEQVAKTVEATMRAEATVWYKSRPDFVRANVPELRAQADGMAKRLGSQYGVASGGAAAAFMETVAHLGAREASLLFQAFDVVQEGPFDVPTGSSLPVGVDNKDTFDDSLSTPADPKSTTNTGEAQSLGEGATPASDQSATIDNPESHKEHANDGKDTTFTDYLDGTTTPNTKTNNETFSSRKTAGGYAVWSKDNADWHSVPDDSPWAKEDAEQALDADVNDQPDLEGDLEVRPYDGKTMKDSSRKVSVTALVDAVMAWESGTMSSKVEAKFFQHLISTGMAWQLQPMYAARANALITTGVCKTAEDGSFASPDTSSVPSLDEGAGTESDGSEAATQEPVANEDHSGGDSEAIDYLDGSVYPKQGRRRTADATTGPKPEGSPGPFDGITTPLIPDEPEYDDDGSKDYKDDEGDFDFNYEGDNKNTNTSGWRPESAEKALDHKNNTASRRTAGEVPESFKKQWDKAGDDDSDENADGEDSDDDSDDKGDDKTPDFIQKKIDDSKKESRRTALAGPVRPLYVIAGEIRRVWSPVNYAAKPYLDALDCLNDINDSYGMDGAKSVIAYFLSNATSFRGEDARRIKKELKGIMDSGGSWGGGSQAARHTAEGMKCEKCGDPCEKDPAGEANAGYHHTNSGTHDHEAKPGSGDYVKDVSDSTGERRSYADTKESRINSAFAARVQANLKRH